MISAADLEAPEYMAAPDETKATAVGLWLHLDPLGRGLMDPEELAAKIYPLRPPEEASETVLSHLVQLMDVGFLTTYMADGEEWILLLRPLKTDLRRTKIYTPEPPKDRPWTSVAVGGGRERARARARARVRARVRAEDAARAEAWVAVQEDAAPPPEKPERPMLLDAPPMFCDDHMPHGAGQKKCGPCRDSRVKRDEWLTRRIYEEKLAEYDEQIQDEEVWDDEPF